MKEFILSNTLEHNNFITDIFTEKKLKEFLTKEGIPCLSSRFLNHEDFYNKILFQIPETEKHKNYKMIYTHLIDPIHYNYLEKKELLKELKIKEEKLVAEGSVTLIDATADEKGRKPFVRWIIIKN
jgi:hypothetical protein